jgi:hypothetical protein
MLQGTADPESLAAYAATMPSLHPEPLELGRCEVLQAHFELRHATREAVVPPALHPTNPPTLVVQAWSGRGGPLGPFTLAQVRVGTRSGLRPRGFVVGCVVEGEAVAAELASRFGYPCRAGVVRLRRGYDVAQLDVEVDGRPVLALTGVDPDPLDPADVQYSVTLTLARTPRGLRLVQVEPDLAVQRVERVRARFDIFDGAAWGDGRLDPYHPISATIATADLVIPPPRFTCRPDVLAFEGTEPITADT